MVRIIIKNHEQVARQHSILAGVAARFAPEYLRNKVDRDFARQLHRQLRERGIDAEVIVEPTPVEQTAQPQEKAA